MTHVTITYHNRIEGALEIAHLPRTFVSEEITSYFPEDRCKVHILALNITEGQHRNIQSSRENIYDLVDYLIDSNIFHIVAHPLYSVNGRLTIRHFEKLLLLFKNFEMNGARNDATNDILRTIIENLTPAHIERLANEHDLCPKMNKPWQKNITGGSDDHSSLNIARTYTEIPGANSLLSALKIISEGRARIIRNPSSPLTFAHNLYGIAYQYYRNKFDLERYAGNDTLLDFIDYCLQPEPAKNNRKFMSKLYCLWHYRKRPRLQSQVPESLAALIRRESGRLLYDHPELMEVASSGTMDNGELEKKWFDFVNKTSNRMTLNLARNLMNHLSGANVFNIFQTIGEAGGLYAMVAPYLISFSYFSQDRVFNEKIILHFNSDNGPGQRQINELVKRNVAHFTDHVIPSQALIQPSVQRDFETKYGFNKLIILGCGQSRPIGQEEGYIFEPVGTYEHPDFPDDKLLFPPFMEMLDFCYSRQINTIHSASPGPMGLAAIGVARLLRIPVFGRYHPSVTSYLPFLGEEESVEEILQQFMTWYYNQLDRIYVYSPESYKHLTHAGVDAQKIQLIPSKIDTHCFKTLKADRGLYPFPPENGIIRIVYAGPITKENNLSLLAEVYKILRTQRKNLHFDIVGDGTGLGELKRLLEGYPITLYGRLSPADRAEVFKNGSIFIYPGVDIDDGYPLLEAQASGLPVIVPDHDILRSFVLEGQTGFVFKPNDAARLYDVMLRLIDDQNLRYQMGEIARYYAESLLVDATAFSAYTPNTANALSQEEFQLAEAV
jgi:glycosyltransferase involved in cell wall biosynthesis